MVKKIRIIPATRKWNASCSKSTMIVRKTRTFRVARRRTKTTTRTGLGGNKWAVRHSEKVHKLIN